MPRPRPDVEVGGSSGSHGMSVPRDTVEDINPALPMTRNIP